MTSGRTSTVRRPVVVISILLVLVAVLLVAFRSWLDRPAPEIDIATETVVPAESKPEPAEPAVEPEPVLESIVVERPTPERIGVPVMVVTPPVPVTVIMLPARVASAGPEAATVTEVVRQSTLRALRAMPDIDVVEISSAELSAVVPPTAGSLGEDSLVYLAVTRRHAGRVVAEISEIAMAESSWWFFNLRVHAPTGSGSSTGRVGKTGDLRPGGDVQFAGLQFAERIARDAKRVASESEPVASSGSAADAPRSIFLDATRADEERLRSLEQILMSGPDDTVLAVAVEMATQSTSAETRRRMWRLLRRSAYEPGLAQPLSFALLNDVDAAVRQEAALGLAAYVGEAATAVALEQASRNDPSTEVRLAARMATMTPGERQGFQRATLLDSNLTPAERLAPLIVDDRTILWAFEASSGNDQFEEAVAYAEVVAGIEDPALKLTILRALNTTMFSVGTTSGLAGADGSRIVDALIESSRHADNRVREQALESLLVAATQMGAKPEARAVLESVLENEPALAAELGIERALARSSLPGARVR